MALDLILGRMAADQEAAMKAATIKAAYRSMMVRLPHVTYTMECFDACEGDLKFLMLLEQITSNQETQLLEDLQAAEQRIKKVGSM